MIDYSAMNDLRKTPESLAGVCFRCKAAPRYVTANRTSSYCLDCFYAAFRRPAPQRPPRDPWTILLSKRAITDTGCWVRADGRQLNAYGYQRVSNGDRRKSTGWFAHRLAYERCVGALDPELTIDHLCRNKRCFNPDHLEEVTNAENNARGFSTSANNARKTHCKRGHELSGTNLYRAADGSRQCRTCRRMRRRAAK